MIDFMLNAPAPVLATAFALTILITAVAYAIFAKDDALSDTALLDFLDQKGFSIQRLADGWCAVTDGSQKLVGRPAQDVREAIMSALDVVAMGEMN